MGLFITEAQLQAEEDRGELISDLATLVRNLDVARRSVVHFAGRVADNPANADQVRSLHDAVTALKRRAALVADANRSLADAGYLDITIAPAQGIGEMVIGRDPVTGEVCEVEWTGDDSWSYVAGVRIDGDFEVTRHGGHGDRHACGRVPESDILAVAATGRAMGLIRQAGGDDATAAAAASPLPLYRFAADPLDLHPGVTYHDKRTDDTFTVQTINAGLKAAVVVDTDGRTHLYDAHYGSLHRVLDSTPTEQEVTT